MKQPELVTRTHLAFGATLVATALVLVLASASAWSQERFDVQQFNPTVSQFTGFFTTPSGRVIEGGRWELGLLFNYADDPLVLYNVDDERIGSLVSGQLTANVMGAVGIANRLDIGFDIPIILYQEGDARTFLPGAEASDVGVGLGDIRLVPRVMLVGPRDVRGTEGVALGLLVDTRIPTGDRDAYQGEGFRIEPRLALDIGVSGFRFGGSVGYLIRTDPTRIENVEVDDMLTWSLAAGFPLADTLQLIPEVWGGFMLLGDELDSEDIPLEAVLGLKWFPSRSVLVQAGGGAGLVRGVGTPDFRLFLGLSFSPEAVRDRDGDGVPDDVDVCPDVYGTRPDGCPDPDRDGDGVCDPWVTEAGLSDYFSAECRGLDICPDVYGERADGCPNPDRDGDGVCDPWVSEAGLSQHFAPECRGVDACPDLYGEREDGCPNPDRDGDRVCDPWVTEHGMSDYFAGVCRGLDRCPDEYGEDEHGCPILVTVTCVAIEISDRVHFEFDSDVIESRSFRMLNEVARVINEASWIRRVRVEGHTDNVGTDRYNIDLSQRRAASVMRYLLDQGVDMSRLESQGYGFHRPIATNDTEEGRALNRRVEFHITEQDDCPQ